MQSNTSFAHSAYQQGQVAASSPLRIISLLYDGAIRFCKQAEKHFGDPSTRGSALGRAHAIVSELLVALDLDRGGEVATNLDGLYRYVLDALIRANVEGEHKALASAIQVLETLADGWHELAKASVEGAP
jgi:flagellar protein FliS